MNRDYNDILSAANTQPSFFQKDGVPRWGSFTPGISTDVYAIDVVIMEIACQSCDTRFHVLMERRDHSAQKPFSKQIANGTIHYGDPPNVGCCDCGPSMNSEPVQIIEHWTREGMQWTRHPNSEQTIIRSGEPLTALQIAQIEAMVAKTDDEVILTAARELLESQDEVKARHAEKGEPRRFTLFMGNDKKKQRIPE